LREVIKMLEVELEGSTAQRSELIARTA
jgi:predicted  nucleic acid-binding Zn-ribbon protein